MFSAFTNAQNKVSSIPITAVTWSIGGNTNSTYTGAAQFVTVVSVTPPGATYSTSTTTATNAESVASTTITGTGIYTGTFTSPNLTIVAATLTGTKANPSATYNAASQTGTVITDVNAAPGNYTGSLTASGTDAGRFTSSITGTVNYTGTVDGGTFTISKRQLTLANFGFFDCDGNDNGYGQVQVIGIQGSESCSLTMYRGDINTYNGGEGGVAPVTTTFTTPPYDQVYNDPPGVTNPRSISNADLGEGAFGLGPGFYKGIVMKRTLNYLYWVGLSGSSNYISSPLSPAFQGFGPINQECGV